MMNRKLASVLACGVCVVAMAAPASAQTRTYNIPAGSLKSALDSYGRQSGRPIIYKADQIRGLRSRGASGALSREAALDAILAGTPFRAQPDSSGAVAIVSTQVSGQSTLERISQLDHSVFVPPHGSRIGSPFDGDLRTGFPFATPQPPPAPNPDQEAWIRDFSITATFRAA